MISCSKDGRSISSYRLLHQTVLKLRNNWKACSRGQAGFLCRSSYTHHIKSMCIMLHQCAKFKSSAPPAFHCFQQREKCNVSGLLYTGEPYLSKRHITPQNITCLIVEEFEVQRENSVAYIIPFSHCHVVYAALFGKT